MDEKKVKKNKWNIVLIIGIIILAIAIILLVFSDIRHAIFRFLGIESKTGNTIGNINNFGYATEDLNYIYYMAPNSNGQYIGINKVKKSDLTGKQTRLIEGTWELTSINSYGDYIYFVSLSQNNVDENNTKADEVDNKIHRVKKNGDQKDEVINDNDFHNYSYKIVVTGGKVYYIGKDECIWYMDLDGKNKTKLNDNASGFEFVSEKYIVYNMPKFKDGEETSSTYIMDRNGKNAREINGERLFTPIIYKDYIYYLTAERYIHKMKLDGSEDIMLSDAKVYNLNVSKNGIYFFGEIKSATSGSTEALALYRMDLDGNNKKKIYTLEESSNSLCLLKDWVFFLDSNSEEGRMELVSPDGKQKIDLFKINYADYYYLDELVEQRRNELSETENDSEAVQKEQQNETIVNE